MSENKTTEMTYRQISEFMGAQRIGPDGKPVVVSTPQGDAFPTVLQEIGGMKELPFKAHLRFKMVEMAMAKHMEAYQELAKGALERNDFSASDGWLKPKDIDLGTEPGEDGGESELALWTKSDEGKARIGALNSDLRELDSMSVNGIPTIPASTLDDLPREADEFLSQLLNWLWPVLDPEG